MVILDACSDSKIGHFLWLDWQYITLAIMRSLLGVLGCLVIMFGWLLSYVSYLGSVPT